MSLSRNTPLRAKSWCRTCGKSLCDCGEPPKLKRTPLNPVNRERKRRRREAGEVYGAFHRWLSTLPCILMDAPGHECLGTVTGHHVKSVGAGGKDWANEVPVCADAHAELHHAGRETFETRYGLDLSLIAAGLAERYEEAA